MGDARIETDSMGRSSFPAAGSGVGGRSARSSTSALGTIRSLMLVTALAPVFGYDKASKIAHQALEHDLTRREAALQLDFAMAAS